MFYVKWQRKSTKLGGPYNILKLISMLGKNFKFKIDKIFGNDFHSSKELESLGFKTKKTFLDI